MEIIDIYVNICKKRDAIDKAYNIEWHRTYPNKMQLHYFKGELDILVSIKELIENSGLLNDGK